MGLGAWEGTARKRGITGEGARLLSVTVSIRGDFFHGSPSDNVRADGVVTLRHTRPPNVHTYA